MSSSSGRAAPVSFASLVSWRRVLTSSLGKGWESDKNRFTTFVLGYLNSLGFKMDGSIPMGKAGHLGFGSRKELWVFKALQQRRPGSALGRNRENSMNGARDGSAHGHSSAAGHGSMHDHDD